MEIDLELSQYLGSIDFYEQLYVILKVDRLSRIQRISKGRYRENTGIPPLRINNESKLANKLTGFFRTQIWQQEIISGFIRQGLFVNATFRQFI